MASYQTAKFSSRAWSAMPPMVVEHPAAVADRILAYANIVGRENVIAGTDCGLGGRVHSQIAWAKLRALRDGAAIASKKLWS